MKALKNLSAEAAGVILSIIVIIGSVGATFGITQHQINQHEETLEQMENQYRKDHDILLEIKRDVHWIRAVVESKSD
jgi:methionine synthase I (cobalamin-dependent)